MKKIVYGGWGLAHYEGRTLFLPCTAPGDKIEFRVTAEKKKCLFGEVTRIIQPSSLRREPECPAFGRCGGCHMLHLGYEDELEAKKISVRESLKRIGKVTIDIPPLTASPSRFGYRNHVLFKVGADGRKGFSARESSSVVPFPAAGCLLIPEIMREAISELRIESPAPGAEIRARLDKYGTVHFWGIDDRTSPPDILMESGDFLFPLAPDAFFQVNRLLNRQLMERVVSLPSRTARRLVDLYCGVGFFTLPLSRIAGEIVGIERDPAAYRSALAAARLNRVANV
ncbi:MAG: class I SAM-dependent RNA methyltransferase, partial [Candidatus Krumholzibacteriota bacterium]|nr:class I SAM-dependent RNA methyltransferase [Candidatus Krumholzibacteriota bacterium]